MTTCYYAPNFLVRIAGSTLSADVTNQVTSVTYENSLDVADMASIVLRNPDNRLLDSALCDLGKRFELHMGYGNDLEPMMLGEVTAAEPDFPESGAPTVKITAYDLSYRMRHNQPDRPPFLNVNDSIVAVQIAVENGLIPIVDPSLIFHRKALPQTGSDMAFLSERAKANFFEAYVYWDKLFFQFPRPQTEAIVLEWGSTLSSFSPRIASSSLAGLQVIRGYNEELAQTIVTSAVAADLDASDLIERLGSSARDLLMSMGRRVINDQKVESPVDATVLAQSILRDILEGLCEGSGACIGLPTLRASKFVTIRGVGKRFSGRYRLRKVTHTINDAGYQTSFEVSQRNGSNLLSLTRKYLVETPAPKERERHYGVAVAKVVKNAEAREIPPELPIGRVQVTFPWLSDQMQSGWARCATPAAGKDRGFFFLPEIGDEVLVAFEQGDTSRPVVIGSLWNGQQMPPVTNDGTNSRRMIKTKSGHVIEFDDGAGRESIAIRHKGGTEVLLGRDGSVRISAKNDITLDSGGTLRLKAAQGISLDANDVDVKVKTKMNVSS